MYRKKQIKEINNVIDEAFQTFFVSEEFKNCPDEWDTYTKTKWDVLSELQNIISTRLKDIFGVNPREGKDGEWW